MKIFTVRHGQTFWNVEGRLQGHTDIALNEVGLSQAEKLSLRLAEEKIDIIYTSTLVRASKTAEIINSRHNVEIIPATELMEICCGIFEGRIVSEVADELAYYRETDQVIPGGEDIYEYSAKIGALLDKIISGNHQNIVIVGHAFTIRAIICNLLKVPINESQRFRTENTAIHCFERDADGVFTMVIENDTSHLGE